MRILPAAARTFAEGALELLYPTRCISCELSGGLLCDSCKDSLPWICQRWACPVCGAPFGYLTCTECDRSWPVRSCVSAMSFEGAAASMATKLKDAHELRLAPVIAAAMEAALEEAAAWPALDGRPRAELSELDAICFVPATASAYRRRGFDHMELVAAELSRLTGIPLADVLVRDAARDQRELNRQDREENLSGTIHVLEDVRGMRLLLADDVITTGASICEAARALAYRGASEICACSLARVW